MFGTCLVTVRDASRVSSWCEYEDFECARSSLDDVKKPWGGIEEGDEVSPWVSLVFGI